MDKATIQFQNKLKKLAYETGLDNRTGLFPLNSEFRQLGISYSTFFGAARALILQIAHPTVAQGVFEYSDFKNDPVGRGVRTFLGVFMIGIGTQESAVKTGTHVFERHIPIKGTIPGYERGMKDRAYSAMEPGANLWVWATLVEGILFGHSEIQHKVDPDRLEQFYEETKLFGKFFNVKDSLIPETLSDFLSYFQDMIDNHLHVSPAGQAVGHALVKGYKFPTQQSRWMLRALAAESLPEKIRDAFGWRSTFETRTIYKSLRNAAQAYYAVAPNSLKVVPLMYGPQIRKAIEIVKPSLIPVRFPLGKAA